MNKGGLIGYYYQDLDFKELILIEETQGATLNPMSEDFQSINNILDKDISLIVWKGFIKVESSGTYKIYTNNKSCFVKVGDSITQDNDSINSIVLNDNIDYPIYIEKFFDEKISLNNLNKINLLYEFNSKEYEFLQENMKTPNFSNTYLDKFIPTKRLSLSQNITLSQNINLLTLSGHDPGDDSILDTDNDGIPDDWEVNGYTVINKKVVKWDDSYLEKGLKKYISNPYSAHTANDPYTDYEKTAAYFDKGIVPEARDPLVVAFPSISVSMEKLIVSNNSTISEQHGVSKSKTVTNSVSRTITESITSGASAGVSGVSISASATFSNAITTSNSISDTTSESFTNSLNINLGSSAFLNPNIRYRNHGTCPIYNVQPTASLIVNSETVSTIKVQANQIGNFLSPGLSYPKDGLNPLALNTLDQFSSHLISINYDQLKSIDDGKPILLETDQVDGNYLTIDSNGQTIIEKNDWNKWMSQIEETSARFVFQQNNIMIDRRVVAKDFNDPNDMTPVLTIKEAIVKAFGCNEKDSKIYYKDISFDEQDILMIYDKETSNKIQKQLSQNNNLNVFDVNIESKMEILIKVPVLSMSFDDPETNPFLKPSFDYFGYKIINDANLGLNGNSLCFSPELRRYYNKNFDVYFSGGKFKVKALEKHNKYIATMYLKSKGETNLDIYIGENNSYKNINIKDDKITKVMIPFTADSDEIYFMLNIHENDKTLYINHLKFFEQ